MIAMYDLEDNIVKIFDTTKDCADYFNTTNNCIRSYLCRQKKGKIKKKRDLKEKKWYVLYKMEVEDDS